MSEVVSPPDIATASPASGAACMRDHTRGFTRGSLHGSTQESVRALIAIGRALGPAQLQASEALWADRLQALEALPVRAEYDLPYGVDERQRLDAYAPCGDGPPHPRPIFLFVPGGGFTGGDKAKPGLPFHGNVGRWAAAQGWLGLVMNYRLAPAHAWPAASEDVAAALDWVRAHAARLGGDASRIVLAGHSAGAAHVAGFIAHRSARAGARQGLRGAVLLSGIYDVTAMGERQNVQSYYGADGRLHAARSSVTGLAESDVPLFVGVAGEDPDGFHAQAQTLLACLQLRRGRLPDFMVAQDHNHYTETLHLGSGEGELGPALERFVRRHTAPSGAPLTTQRP